MSQPAQHVFRGFGQNQSNLKLTNITINAIDASQNPLISQTFPLNFVVENLTFTMPSNGKTSTQTLFPTHVLEPKAREHLILAFYLLVDAGTCMVHKERESMLFQIIKLRRSCPSTPT